MSTPDWGNAGTKDDPWLLKTPPGTSEYTMHRDESADPPELVCTVGKTVLKYQLRLVADLAAMLAEHGDWMELGSADEQKPAKDGRLLGIALLLGSCCLKHRIADHADKETRRARQPSTYTTAKYVAKISKKSGHNRDHQGNDVFRHQDQCVHGFPFLVNA